MTVTKHVKLTEEAHEVLQRAQRALSVKEDRSVTLSEVVLEACRNTATYLVRTEEQVGSQGEGTYLLPTGTWVFVGTGYSEVPSDSSQETPEVHDV